MRGTTGKLRAGHEDGESEGSPRLEELLSLVAGKRVSLITHWDADGVSSGALLYHLIRAHAESVFTSSKGDVFSVGLDDIGENPDIVICTDIQPSPELDPRKVIYIDHHPLEEPERFLMAVHDEHCQSTSLLIWTELIPETRNPYFVFLSLLGYFGDGGRKEELPKKLLDRAMELIPDMMVERQSFYDPNKSYLEIEKHIPAINTGKRMHWSGDLPLEMLKNIHHHDLFIRCIHPIAEELNGYRSQLRSLYNMELKLVDLPKLHYGVIESKRNVQGVLCARHMKDKPIIVLNRFNGKVIGSMRVPDHMDFDAGKFLNQFNSVVPSFLGGGHEKAGGFTFDQEQLPLFLKELERVAK